MTRNFSPKSKAVIQYRLDNERLPLEVIGHKFGLTRQRVKQILDSAGVQSAAVPYEGMDCHIRNVPKEVVESVKDKAKSTEGKTFRLKTIELWQDYRKGE
jgi:hypothetical protein